MDRVADVQCKNDFKQQCTWIRIPDVLECDSINIGIGNPVPGHLSNEVNDEDESSETYFTIQCYFPIQYGALDGVTTTALSLVVGISLNNRIQVDEIAYQ
ncbi:hypothetical protein CDAR_220881 [Caerostris darwini]|uniref:Uncharacterized protein n=1 Tax=Caerostris darwini TaxID=1538125 RepID=A0AAV4MUX6_9ARAC|nr:hypothetical protein CDAR_220881 [Caerostris darwini]